jgi:hypothetical protein
MLYLIGICRGGAMTSESRAGDGAREILMVLGVAFIGLVLAALAAFTPWYASGENADPGTVVEVYGPVVGIPRAIDR